jgi:hypothetical protein
MFVADAMRAARTTLLDIGAGFLEGLHESPQVFFSPLVGAWTEVRRVLADLDAKHIRKASGRI